VGNIQRRQFIADGASAVFLCGLAGGRVFPFKTASDVKAADAAARKVKRPKRVPKDPVDTMSFPTPQPQPGGVAREYWIQARPISWDPVPTGRDEWMNMKVPRKRRFTALAYQEYNEGFAQPLGPPTIPGPKLEAEVGDTLVVHFRNDDRHYGQAHTMHPHGVRYTPDYDGSYLSSFTRAGGFIAPGDEFTYTWEALPGSAGVWPYHDHGPNGTISVARGLFGTVIIREKGAKKPDVEQVLVLHAFTPQITQADANFQCFNGRAFAGNTPTVRSKVGQDVAFHAYGGDGMFHTFHVHGHRWLDPAGAHVDNPSFGPHEVVTARWTEDNPGRWLYHCHVFSHQDAGMAGWYLVEP
jgi:FtsP/CotA-like multicopper oxidase with cupredoxin domain